ncbi:Forkhead box protein I1 [Apophysomyces ossiformis]|uniref:Forkhead box protein I1 n=1 Tax=Apophysomyces ossiformis TaxID=679940 RepID=A0A8H7EPD0_9FUNG|nr:Forkhead box protein I1 [Apophysomyces ossiformis]
MPEDDTDDKPNGYLPPIPVVMRHPYIVGSVKQYRIEEQQQQLHQHIISESFIPMSPNLTRQPRKRRRPPFSYSSLIAQAILESENERMTLRDIYSWIEKKYPALYNAEDTGWQNTIRHNLSLNKCFRKVPKSELKDAVCHGKGGYWTIDPNHMARFKDGAFARGSSSSMRRRFSKNKSKADSEDSKPVVQKQQQQQSQQPPPTPQHLSPMTVSLPHSKNPLPSCTETNSSSSPSSIMQIHNLLN